MSVAETSGHERKKSDSNSPQHISLMEHQISKLEEPYVYIDAFTSDFEEITALLREARTDFFGYRRRKIENPATIFAGYTTHAVLVRENNDRKALVGFGDFNIYPKLLALPNDCWMLYIKHHYCIDLNLSVRNVLFLTSFIFSKQHVETVLPHLLSEIFLRERVLRYILVIEMPDDKRTLLENKENYYIFDKISKVYYPKVFSVATCRNSPRIHIIERDSVVLKMTYRRALPEDNDDIIHVLDRDHPNLRSSLGDYFIAEELLREDKTSNILVVSEVNHVTVGFVWLNDAINVHSIITNFNAEAFNNFLKFDKTKPYAEESFFAYYEQRKPPEKLFEFEAIQHVLEDEVIKTDNRHTILELYKSGSKDALATILKCAQISKQNEELYTHGDFLNKINIIGKRLKNLEHYFLIYSKPMKIQYNLPDNTAELAMGADVFIDTQANAFAIQLIGLSSHSDYRRVARLLAASFSACPDRDYCLISVPHGDKNPKIILELLKYFVSVVPRPECTIREHVYLTHRSAILGDICMYPATFDDFAEIESIISDSTRSVYLRRTVVGSYEPFTDENIMAKRELSHVRNILFNLLTDPLSKYHFMTIRVGNATKPAKENIIVGFVILKPFFDRHLMHRHFSLVRDYRDLYIKRVQIIDLRLNPIFHIQWLDVFLEMVRLIDCWDFYYMHPMRGATRIFSNDLAYKMQPIEPKRIKKFLGDDHSMPQNNVDDPQLGNMNFRDDNFALFQYNLRSPRLHAQILTEIVILGFDPIARAFLRQMVFSWTRKGNEESTKFSYLPELRITVICATGHMEAAYDVDFQCDVCGQGKNCWISRENDNSCIRDVIRRMDMRMYVRFVSGALNSIDVKNQVVKVHNCEQRYEKLLILCGVRFAEPKRIASSEKTPSNFVYFNRRFHKITFFLKLRVLQEEYADAPEKMRILIYDVHFMTFEVIDFLLTHGIKAESIILVIPPDPTSCSNNSVENNPEQDKNIILVFLSKVKKMGITVHRNCVFSKWTTFRRDKDISTVSFICMDDKEVYEFRCDFFISFKQVYISHKYLHVIKQSGIELFKDQILVDSEYRTSDPNIFAIGNYTKHYEEPFHQYRHINPMEAASKLIHILDLKKSNNYEERFAEPRYFQSIILGWQLVKITMPRRYIFTHTKPGSGYKMVTFDGIFTRIRLNDLGIVDEITVLSSRMDCYDYLQFFCGKHELLLNNLRGRFQGELIKSILSFLQEPWSELLMHNRFAMLTERNMEFLKQLVTELHDLDISRNCRRELIKLRINAAGGDKEIEKYFLHFLRRYRNEFRNNYALPEDFIEEVTPIQQV